MAGRAPRPFLSLVRRRERVRGVRSDRGAAGGSVKARDDFGELGIVDAQPLQMFVGISDIGRIVAIEAHALRDESGHFVRWQAAGILGVIAIDDIGERIDAAAVSEAQSDGFFEINRSHQLPFAQIGDGLRARIGRDTEGDPIARPAMVKSQHETRPFRRPAMNMRENTKAAMVALNRSPRALDEGKPRSPDQGAVAEHPEVFCARSCHVLFAFRAETPVPAPDIGFSTTLSVAERSSAHNIMFALSCNCHAFVADIRA